MAGSLSLESLNAHLISNLDITKLAKKKFNILFDITFPPILYSHKEPFLFINLILLEKWNKSTLFILTDLFKEL